METPTGWLSVLKDPHMWCSLSTARRFMSLERSMPDTKVGCSTHKKSMFILPTSRLHTVLCVGTSTRACVLMSTTTLSVSSAHPFLLQTMKACLRVLAPQARTGRTGRYGPIRGKDDMRNLKAKKDASRSQMPSGYVSNKRGSQTSVWRDDTTPEVR